MPVTRNFKQAFSGGEISPEMFGRIADNKFLGTRQIDFQISPGDLGRFDTEDTHSPRRRVGYLIRKTSR